MPEIKIKSVLPLENFLLQIVFDDGKTVFYDVKEDFQLPGYSDLKTIPELFQQVRLDQSRTCIVWNDYIDLPSDILYEYGKKKKERALA